MITPKVLLILLTLAVVCLACDQQPQEKQAPETTAVTEKKEAQQVAFYREPDSAVLAGLEAELELPDSLSPEKRQAIMEKISKKYLMGKFNPAQDERFAKIPSPYAKKEMYMRQGALASFKKMHAAAKEDGIPLLILSATRPFDVQKSIWEAKWTGKRKVDGQLLSSTVKDPKGRATKILRWSSMPSTSRHHWGTDIDINSLEPDYFAQGQGLKEYEWLVANAPQFGFCQVYSEMGPDRPYGYQEEKWHWSYLPISKDLTEAYAQKITDQDIEGFMGAESAPMIEVVKKYVLGINPACL
ncbi:MAG: M15 family metallopeptidase [Aureispira sp.]